MRPAETSRHLSARDRFQSLDEYRVDREWKRYEGTPLRDLFRQLRERFLDRHRVGPGRTLEVGPGPGRFSARIGGPNAERVLLDLSGRMLRSARRRLPPGGRSHLILGDAVVPPFSPGSFQQVVALGNPLGFAESEWKRLFASLLDLVAPGGSIVLEFAPARGERSRYLARLPVGAVARLFQAPPRAILPRIDREGFEVRAVTPRLSKAFQNLSALEVGAILSRARYSPVEAMAVAPTVGADSERIAAVARDPVGWAHLLEVEETIGRRPARLPHAAAVLVAARRQLFDALAAPRSA